MIVNSMNASVAALYDHRLGPNGVDPTGLGFAEVQETFRLSAGPEERLERVFIPLAVQAMRPLLIIPFAYCPQILDHIAAQWNAQHERRTTEPSRPGFHGDGGHGQAVVLHPIDQSASTARLARSSRCRKLGPMCFLADRLRVGWTPACRSRPA